MMCGLQMCNGRLFNIKLASIAPQSSLWHDVLWLTTCLPQTLPASRWVQVVVLETKLTDNIAMARLEVQDKEILTDEFAQVMPEEATQIRSKASPEPQHEEIEAGVVALAEKEKQVGVQQYLESMLQEAESSAEESKEVVREMEGVIAGLREDEVRVPTASGCECLKKCSFYVGGRFFCACCSPGVEPVAKFQLE